MKYSDVCIIGAGPAGCAAALKLSHLGIPCILVDRATFPRDKICGDAISGKSPLMMSRLDPDMLDRFMREAEYEGVWGIRFGAPNGKNIDVPFKMDFDPESDPAPGFVCKRMEFDNFLVKEVKKRNNITFLEKIHINEVSKIEDGFILSNQSEDFSCQVKILLDGSGAQSSFSRKYAGLEKDIKHNAGAVRGYYKNVKFPDQRHFIELHFIKEFLPGYFWIFPLPNGEANVGLGMRTDKISKKKVNLKKEMEWIIHEHPDFRDRFADAVLIDKIKGYGLPLGSKKRKISGDHFMLMGDAAHLIDPVTGEGIGNAFYSGIYAAEQAQKCLLANDFSSGFIEDYDVRIQRVLGKEMKLSYRIQQLLNFPHLANFMANTIVNNKKIIDALSRMYLDFEYRKKIINPLFWFKLRR